MSTVGQSGPVWGQGIWELSVPPPSFAMCVCVSPAFMCGSNRSAFWHEFWGQRGWVHSLLSHLTWTKENQGLLCMVRRCWNFALEELRPRKKRLKKNDHSVIGNVLIFTTAASPGSTWFPLFPYPLLGTPCQFSYWGPAFSHGHAFGSSGPIVSLCSWSHLIHTWKKISQDDLLLKEKEISHKKGKNFFFSLWLRKCNSLDKFFFFLNSLNFLPKQKLNFLWKLNVSCIVFLNKKGRFGMGAEMINFSPLPFSVSIN